ncbi:S-adenosyl-L-methionine-dependent methyltransferase [Mariannaea sp. PMI_226]|nr:S-adenosyl-L-methionine-dependent methyltransferase [Mariannaea sp. PMI_226]
MATSAPPPIAKLPFAEHGAHWDLAWRESRTPWDNAGPSVALSDLLSQRQDLVPPSQAHDHRGLPLRDATGAVEKKKALVPGCGRGHDVLLLSSWGYDVWGLDYSSTAKEQAIENQKNAEAAGSYKAVHGLEKGAIHWVTGDFFGQEWTESIGSDFKFDLIYDYTFLCALPREARPQWSKRITELLAHDGRLVCLEFPTAKPMSADGPPWGVSPELYEALLSAPGEEILYHANGTVNETPSPKPRVEGLHRLSLIKPLRTHSKGTSDDGSVLDFISVWSR